jgi:hypothetical protein
MRDEMDAKTVHGKKVFTRGEVARAYVSALLQALRSHNENMVEVVIFDGEHLRTVRGRIDELFELYFSGTGGSMESKDWIGAGIPGVRDIGDGSDHRRMQTI